MKKTVINEMKLTFVSRSENEAFARQATCAFVSRLDPSLEEISDLRIIVSEAVTNCIIHAYPESQGLIHLSLKLFSDDSVRLCVKDQGVGIEDIEKCMQPLYSTCPKTERGGMGLPIIKALADDFRISSAVGKGTKITVYMSFQKNT